MERAELNTWVRGLGCATESGGYVFLRDPHWPVSDVHLAKMQIAEAEQLPSPDVGWLCIRTGGSGGGVKFARHDEHTVGAAVAGFCRHFNLSRVNAVGVLPPWHVSGFMARLRCAVTGGEYVDCAWKALERGDVPRVPASGEWVLSLVPTQLQRLLASGPTVEWLRSFRIIFLGGGPVWPELAAGAAAAGLPVSLSYGMTETAAMMTAQQPHEFLGGDRSAGKPMSHARVRIDADGHVVIAAESLFRGYFPEKRSGAEFTTSDLGRFDDEGRLHLLGRSDAVIISGGKKVHPVEVEAVLRGSGEFEDVVVLGVPDPEWGQRVVACYPERSRTPNLEKAMQALAAFQRPKQFVAIADWPRNAQGKINRAMLLEMLSERHGSEELQTSQETPKAKPPNAKESSSQANPP